MKSGNMLTSVEIRKLFLDFFNSNHGHHIVRSSPVVPFSDPSVAFVNAGMNQFKSVLLGKRLPAHRRVCNAQKCIRVGGKHNDISVVGRDSYHHTFFEMLGNWSFGDYFKKEACEMALELLLGPYNINPGRLYVTYFGGDEELGLPADNECRDIWRNLGFPSSRVLPFGRKDNFWEMGEEGPCGLSTEIHIDKLSEFSGTDRAKLVNAGTADVMELWNLVFIQYNRNANGSISKLPSHHIDTGMGLERLTATLQNKNSNYDTDLFVPIFHQIEKVAKVPRYGGCFSNNTSTELDFGYRILADHARMIAISLADGMLPDKSQKLRRVLRKAFTISEYVFANERLLSHLIPIIVELLGPAYPELCFRQNAILEIIDYEKEIFKELRYTSFETCSKDLVEFPKLDRLDFIDSPGLLPAYRRLLKEKHMCKNNTIPGNFLCKLSETYGLTKECLEKLAKIENMLFDEEGYRKAVTSLKFKSKVRLTPDKYIKNYLNEEDSKALSILTKTLTPTDNSFKYLYKFDYPTKYYITETVTATILGILKNTTNICDFESKTLVSPTDTIYIVTNCSNFYNKSGGQQCDQGWISIKLGNEEAFNLYVTDVGVFNDCVVHVCRQQCVKGKEFYLSLGSKVKLVIDLYHRTLNTVHHTGTHLLNEAIQALYKKPTYQISSEVTRDFFKLELGLIGQRISIADVQNIENLISKIINSSAKVNVDVITELDVVNQGDIKVVPGECYPETNLRLVTITVDELNFCSKELCCGTHVTKTAEVENLCITNVKQTNRARYVFTGVAGPLASKVLKTADLLRYRIASLEHEVKSLNIVAELELQRIRNKILHSDVLLPFVLKNKTLEKISGILKNKRKASRTTVKQLLECEISNTLNDKSSPFILYYISSYEFADELPLQKATKLCTDRPMLVVGLCRGIIKARCVVPKKNTTNNFNAELWLREFASVFRAQVTVPKGESGQEICNMKGRKVLSTQFEGLLMLAMQKAENFAKANVF